MSTQIPLRGTPPERRRKTTNDPAPTPEIYYTLDRVVRHALADIGEDLSRYEQFMHYAIQGYMDFKIDQAREIKTIEADLTPYFSIKWPEDYLDWTKVFVWQNGYAITFTQESAMVQAYDSDRTPDKKWSDTQELMSIAVRNQTDLNQNKWGELLGRDYGLSVSHNGIGYIRVNRYRREIQLNTKLVMDGDRVGLEYISDCDIKGPQTLINPLAFKLLVLYIHWQNLEFNMRIPAIQKDRAERLYWAEHRRVAGRLNDWDINTLRDAIGDSTYGVKY